MAKKRNIAYGGSKKKEPIVPIGEAYKKFEYEKKAQGRVAATINNYRKSLDMFKGFCGFTDETDIKSINKQLVIDWMTAMQTETEETPALSASSINHYLRDCRAFFYWCMSDENKYLERFTMPTVSVQEVKQKTYSDKEIERLLKTPEKDRVCDAVEWRCWAITHLAFDMGARAGSIMEIRIEDLNLKKQNVYLRHTKNKALAIFNISTSCARALKQYIELYRYGASGEDYLFVDIGGEPLNQSSLSHSFAKYCKARGVDKTSIHGIRHTFATKLAENTNGNLVRVQKGLGHSSIDMARKYINMAAIDMGDYDEISPLHQKKKNKRGRPKRKID